MFLFYLVDVFVFFLADYLLYYLSFSSHQSRGQQKNTKFMHRSRVVVVAYQIWIVN